VPSAVFSSVTGLFFFSVTAPEPFSSEPPAMPTLAADFDSETS
jgi:hypothetical protein